MSSSILAPTAADLQPWPHHLWANQGCVYCFEPVSATLRVLRWTLALRRLHHVVVVEAALSNQAGTTLITIPLRDGWKPQLPIAHLDGKSQPGVLQEQVHRQVLDAFCATERMGRIDFIKCDTEGHEFFVFAGGLNTIKQHRPHIFCEIAKPYLDRGQVALSATFDLLKSVGYQSYLPTDDGMLTPVDGYCGDADYFFLHPSRLHTQLAAVIVKPVHL